MKDHRSLRYVLVALLALSLPSAAAPAAKNKKVPPGQAKKGRSAPPGLAKKGGLPPGLAKRLGVPAAASAYVAFDPARPDRAWYLTGERWVLRERFEPSVQVEVRHALTLPVVPPPVPLPVVDVRLHVVLFGPP